MEFIKSLSLIQIISIIIVTILLIYIIVQILKVVVKFIIKVVLPILLIGAAGAAVIALIFAIFGNRSPAVNNPTPILVSTDIPNTVPVPSNNFNPVQIIHSVTNLPFGSFVGLIFMVIIGLVILAGLSSASKGERTSPVYTTASETTYPTDNSSDTDNDDKPVPSFVGNDEVYSNRFGQMTFIGNDEVHYDKWGKITFIGNKEVHYDRYGQISFIGDEEVHCDKWGRITAIGGKNVSY